MYRVENELFMRTQEGYFNVNFPSCTRNTKNITQLSALKIRHDSTDITFILTRHIETINGDKKHLHIKH